jgi:hypothetical protein
MLLAVYFTLMSLAGLTAAENSPSLLSFQGEDCLDGWAGPADEADEFESETAFPPHPLEHVSSDSAKASVSSPAHNIRITGYLDSSHGARGPPAHAV